jgi:hypothetical protein
VPGDLGPFCEDHHLGGRNRDPQAAAREPGRHRVVEITGSAEPALGDPHFQATVNVGQRIRQRSQEALFDSPSVTDSVTDPAVMPPKRHGGGPLVVWVWRSVMLSNERNVRNEVSR